MTMFKSVLTAAAVIGLAAPAAAQYQGQVPQPAPGQPGYGYYPQQQGYPQQPGYGQPGYGYNQQNGLGQIINQLLGNRYNVTDRTAIQQCTSAALAQASPSIGRSSRPMATPTGTIRATIRGIIRLLREHRVTAITNVERRNTACGCPAARQPRRHPPHGQAYGYQNQGYAATGDLSFRCNVDYRGAVSNIRVRRANTYRG